MLRNLTLSVLRYERVKTTEAKAKEVRLFVDRMINLGKDGSLGARRRALAWLPEPVIVEKVFTDLAVRWPDRRSGYLRLTHLGRRVGDSAPQMLMELVPGSEKPTAEKTANDGVPDGHPDRPGIHSRSTVSERTLDVRFGELVDRRLSARHLSPEPLSHLVGCVTYSRAQRSRPAT